MRRNNEAIPFGTGSQMFLPLASAVSECECTEQAFVPMRFGFTLIVLFRICSARECNSSEQVRKEAAAAIKKLSEK